jgi:hypothetical protein
MRPLPVGAFAIFPPLTPLRGEGESQPALTDIHILGCPQRREKLWVKTWVEACAPGAFSRVHRVVAAALLCVCFCGQAADPVRLNGSVEGEKLARELREMAPAQDSAIKGTLRIYSPGAEPRDVPLQSMVNVGNKVWDTTYLAHPTNAPREQLSISRAHGASTNHYTWQRGDRIEKPTADSATNSFAGSDFALLDLGLEFFNWPTQTLIYKEMKKGAGCDVLESRPARPGLYSRVVSWIAQESRAQGQPGLVMAEGYDRNGKLLKEFEIKSLQKVAGAHQVSEMEIRNRQAKTRTRLQFEFPEK